MIELKKWNYESHDYEPHRVPDDWHVSLFESDMDRIVNCASCGNALTFGEAYTSMEIQNHMGFGYGVCEKCYEEEWQRRKKNE